MPRNIWTLLAERLGDVLVWVTDRPPQYKRRKLRQTIGGRMMVFVAVVRPDLLPYRSDAELARALNLSRSQLLRIRQTFRRQVLGLK